MHRDVQEIKHDSGLTVLYEPCVSFQTLSINCWYRVGSLDETPDQYGHAHFLEHMLFTASAEKNNIEIMRALQEVGGYSNAFTTFDHTGYECVVPAEFAQQGFAWMQQVLLEPVFELAQIDKEKKVILAEQSDGQDQLEVVFEEKLWQRVYQGGSFGLPILGEPAAIEAVTATSLHAFYQQHYQTGQMVLSVCGDIDRQTLEAHLDKFVYGFLNISTPVQQQAASVAFAPIEFDYQAGHGQRKLDYLWAVPAIDHADVMALELLSACLGGGFYSYLYQHFRQDKKWVTHAQAHLFVSRLGGHFGVELVPLAGRMDDVREDMQRVLAGCDWLTDEMIAWAKKDIEKELLYSLDSSWGRSKLSVYFATLFGDSQQQVTYYEQLVRLSKAELAHVYEKYVQKPFALGVWKALED